MTATTKSYDSVKVRQTEIDKLIGATTPKVGRHRRPQPSGINQWWVLTSRFVRRMIRHHELTVAIVAPLIFTLGFYLPLKFVMSMQGIDYAQFLMPIIVLQAMAFTAISAAQLASTESITGFSTRMQTMPVVGPVPLLARMSSAVVRSLVSLAAALVYGYVIGFRFNSGLDQAFMFCALAMSFAIAFAFAGDAIGSMSKSPAATSQILTLPQLILGMLSCGFVPETGFPEWIRPFVRNQPVSQYSYAMRDLAQGSATWDVLFPAIAWTVGLLAVCVPWAYWASLRRK